MIVADPRPRRPTAPRPTGEARNALAKWLALAFSLVTLVVVIIIAVKFQVGGPNYQFTEVYSWIPAFGVHYAVGVDGIALVLIAHVRGADAGGDPGLVDERRRRDSTASRPTSR